jgi:Kef-type K+ transport system membrane component KefB
MLPLIVASVDTGIEQVMLKVMLQLVVIIVAARIGAIVFRWCKQPAVVGEIAAGLLLGPSCLGYLFPNASEFVFDPAYNQVFGVLSQLGLILLLFTIGLEFDFGHLRWHGKAALAISLMGILFPFGLGIGLAPFMHPYLEPAATGNSVPFLGFALFMGIAMSITAIPILGRMMMELGITRTKIGAVTISAAAVDDACGWILLATVSSIVQANFEWQATLRMLGLTLGFTALMLYAIRPLLKKFIRWSAARDGEEIGLNSLAIVLVVLMLCAMATNLIGIFSIFGAFMLGTVLSDEPEFREALARQLRNFLTVFLLPIFFTYTGLRTNIGSLATPMHWLLFAGVLFSAIFGKLGGCALAAWGGGFSRRDALCIGVMMNTRALMELIVINVGRELGVIPDSVFCMLVLMALLTTIMTTPLLLVLMRGTELEPHILESGFLTPRRIVEKAPVAV